MIKKEKTQQCLNELKTLLREKKLVPNCSYRPDFYFCIGITGTPKGEIPKSFKNCVGCQLGNFLFELSLTKIKGSI